MILRGQLRSPASVIKSIIEADDPKAAINAIPAQTIYVGLRAAGLGGSAEILDLMSIDQCRAALDFDLWRGDTPDERAIFEWLEAASERNDLELFGKIVQSLDLKLVALLIAQYVKVVVHEEPTDQPPGAHFYTPDKGYTWLGITIEDRTHHFLMGKLLAYLFEANQKAFYQIVSAAGFETPTSLSEQAYHDRTTRLLDEGIPDPEIAHQHHASLSTAQFLALLRSANSSPYVPGVPAVDPLVRIGLEPEPLRTFLDQHREDDAILQSLTLLMNSALVVWRVPVADLEEVTNFVQRVKGALNVGCEVAIEAAKRPLEDLYQSVGIIALYRLGLGKLRALSIVARAMTPTESDQELSALRDALSQPFPEMPAFLRPDGSLESESGKLLPGTRPIRTLQEVSMLEGLINSVRP